MMKEIKNEELARFLADMVFGENEEHPREDFEIGGYVAKNPQGMWAAKVDFIFKSGRKAGVTTQYQFRSRDEAEMELQNFMATIAEILSSVLKVEETHNELTPKNQSPDRTIH